MLLLLLLSIMSIFICQKVLPLCSQLSVHVLHTSPWFPFSLKLFTECKKKKKRDCSEKSLQHLPFSHSLGANTRRSAVGARNTLHRFESGAEIMQKESRTGHCECCPAVNNWHTKHSLYSRCRSVSAPPDSGEEDTTAAANASENSCCNSYKYASQ